MDARAIEQAMRNVLGTLQADPARYRNFGIYWWPVKALLKRYYSRDNLYLLGDYEDPDGAGRVPRVSLQEMLQRAFQEYAQNARYNLGRNTVSDAEGEPYRIYDEDAGI